MPEVLIATPIWREKPLEREVAFLQHTDRTNADIDRVFCAPQGMDASVYQELFPQWQIRRFPERCFASVQSYSLWLTAPDFYRSIEDFEFVTICQLDAVLIRCISDIDMTDIDYIGAPWVPPIKVLTPGHRIYVASNQERKQGLWPTRTFGRPLAVGNGGLSIRRIDALIKATQWLTQHVPHRYRENTLEDVLLCAFALSTGLRLPSAEAAGRIFLETGAQDLTEIPAVYGFHGLWRWNPALAATISGN